MTLREELVQVAAVAVAILSDMEQGDTLLHDEAGMQTLAHRSAMTLVQFERFAQERKWGAQHHSLAEWLVILGEEYGEACKAALDETIFPK